MTRRDQILSSFTVADIQNQITLASVQVALMVADELDNQKVKEVLNSN